MSNYQVGDISQKTNLQKQNDGSWKPIGKEKESKEDIKNSTETEEKPKEEDNTSYQDFGDKDKFFHDLYASNYDDVLSSFSDMEHIALDKYRDNDYFSLNASLRKGDKDSIRGKDAQQAKLISSAIQKSKLKHDIVLKRGVTGEKAIEFFKSLKPGDSYSDKGFVSTSLSNKVKDKFKEVEKGISIQINAKKGKSALSMQNIGSEDTKTMYNDEFEFLLDKDSKFKVISNKDNVLSVELL